MHTFKDSAGADWVIQATVGTLKKFKGTPLDLLNGINDKEFYPSLLMDPLKMAEVAWGFVAEQAARKSIDQAAFESRLEGGAISFMVQAVMEEMADFFRPHQPAAAAMLVRLSREVAESGIIQAQKILTLPIEELQRLSSPPPTAGHSSISLPASSA